MQVFSRKIWKVFKNIYFEEYPQTTASFAWNKLDTDIRNSHSYLVFNEHILTFIKPQ